MMALNHILRNCTTIYNLNKLHEKINHLTYMDIRPFTKNERQLDILIQTVRIYSQGIGMEFSIEKCTILVMKSGKQYMTEGIKLPNQEKILTRGDKETYICLGMLEVETIK